MKDRKKFVIGGIICFAFLCFLIVVLASIFKKGNVDERELIPQTGQIQTKPPQSETTPEDKEYLSITYTTSDLSVDTGRMMNFYTYDLGSKKLENKAQIPFESGYALGTVDLSERKIYYTKSVGRAERNVDHLFEYDMEKQTSTMLENVHCAYNDIYLMGNRKLL